MDVSFIDAARYGAAGIAVVGLIIAGGLLKSTLGKRQINDQAQRLIFVFMGFAGLMVIALIGLELLQPKADEKLQSVRTLAGQIDTALNFKMTYDARVQNDPNLKADLKDAIAQVCNKVVAIGKEVGDSKIGASCTERLKSL
jgi:hypothetical protein